MTHDLFSSDAASSVGVTRPPAAMTLSQFAAAIGAVIHRNPALQGVWVTAELSDLRYSGGHCYMELMEKNGAGQTVSKMRANIWRGSLEYVRRKFCAATGRDLMSGIKVMLYGNATYHTLYGLSFNIGDIDPSYTLGDMERLRREILERLAREGVAECNRRMAPPMVPQRVAVISSRGAAGYGDFINQLESNPDGFKIYTHLFPSILQGDRTSAGVRAALDLVERTIDLWDCVVIIRGGGATTDLNGFDEYELARRVATFPLPVAVGIGHERDRTVLDDLACVRCKTPTAVAEWILATLRGAWSAASSLAQQTARYTSDRLVGETRRLSSLESLVPAVASQRIARAQSLLQNVASHLPALATARTARAGAYLESRLEMLRAGSGRLVRAAGVHLDELVEQLSICSADRVTAASRRIESLSMLVKALSPDNTLRRGYSVTRVNGRAVTGPSDVHPGDVLETRLYGGSVRSTVIKS